MFWLLCDPSYESQIPRKLFNRLNSYEKLLFICILDWLTQRCLQVYQSDSTPSALQLRFQQKCFDKLFKFNKQTEKILDIHTQLIAKKVFANNWTK